MWQKVCELAQMPRHGLVKEVVNEVPVLVINGELRRLVVPRNCPHMSTALCEGLFDGHVLTCTKHLWQWSIDHGGTEVGEAETALLCYETRESEGVLWARVGEPLLYDYELDD